MSTHLDTSRRKPRQAITKRGNLVREAPPKRRALDKVEAVNHPAHYGGGDNPYEVIKVIRALGLGFSTGNALKYMARAGKKDPAKHIEDLKKAAWYLNEEIEHVTKQAPAQGSWTSTNNL